MADSVALIWSPRWSESPSQGVEPHAKLHRRVTFGVGLDQQGSDSVRFGSLPFEEVKLMATINGMDQEDLLGFKEAVATDPSRADRWPTVVAEWVGGSRSRITFGEKTTHIGGDDELNPMQFVLAALAACDVDLLVVHATMIGLELQGLRVETSGHFNVQSYIGLEDKPGAGYDQIAYRVILDAPGATPEQIRYLRERCERSSPVGDTLARRVAMTLEFA